MRPNRIKEKTWNELTAKFNVLDYFDFLDNDHDPRLFYQWCEKWSQHSFAPNERLLVIDTDTDYYQENQIHPNGNNIYNFFKCCGYFNIPTEFLIFVSGTFGKNKEVFQLCNYFNLQPPVVIEHLYLNNQSIEQQTIQDIGFNPGQISKLYFCLNGTLRTYRGLLLCHLIEHNLLDQGYLTYHFRDSIKDNTPRSSIDTGILPKIPLRNNIPSTRINDYFAKLPIDYEVYDKHFRQLLITNKSLSDYLDIHDDNDIWNLQPTFLQHALINLVTETAFNYPYPYMSEKTVKAILIKRPFIVVAGSGLLQVLKEFGFKTFDSVWDESYDQIKDHALRLHAVVDLLSSLSNANLEELIKQTQSICDYNFNHYVNNYTDTGLIKYIS
jgi:hypothetical protein